MTHKLFMYVHPCLWKDKTTQKLEGFFNIMVKRFMGECLLRGYSSKYYVDIALIIPICFADYSDKINIRLSDNYGSQITGHDLYLHGLSAHVHNL